MKIIVISDTHGQHHGLSLPDGDTLIHCGDFCGWSTEKDVRNFLYWFLSQSHPNKIFISGNHEIPMEKEEFRNKIKRMVDGKAFYLHDSGIMIDNIKFYGSPWQPEFFDWAFNLPRKGPELKAIWKRIPDDTDILITHGPPHGILDHTRNVLAPNMGCELLRERVKELNLKYHFFGHNHGGYGMDCYNGPAFVNAALCDNMNRIVNKPVVINY